MASNTKLPAQRKAVLGGLDIREKVGQDVEHVDSSLGSR